jgi:hypothetical protein
VCQLGPYYRTLRARQATKRPRRGSPHQSAASTSHLPSPNAAFAREPATSAGAGATPKLVTFTTQENRQAFGVPGHLRHHPDVRRHAEVCSGPVPTLMACGITTSGLDGEDHAGRNHRRRRREPPSPRLWRNGRKSGGRGRVPVDGRLLPEARGGHAGRLESPARVGQRALDRYESSWQQRPVDCQRFVP